MPRVICHLAEDPDLDMDEAEHTLPLAGIRVLELGHVVMGACCSMILADMGAEVIKVEKAPAGDDTRYYKGFGTGLFHYFNRNKSSLSVNLKDERGKEVLRRALGSADVFIENFGPGAVDRMGFDYETCAQINPRLIYCTLKGFMPGPYANRPSLDNLVQMMGGLAYMTGPSGQPLRAGASVTDILGATFGALGILAALKEREDTGRGQQVTATLFESVAFLVGQHMAGAAITGQPLLPMPESGDPWAIYDLFDTADGGKICIGIINDRHWVSFCKGFGLDALAQDTALATNDGRLAQRDRLLAEIGRHLGCMQITEAVAAASASAIPFAPVQRPDELFEDPHLVASGGLLQTRHGEDKTIPLPRLPLRMDGHDFGLRAQAPRVGEGTRPLLRRMAYSETEIDALLDAGVLAIK